MEFLNFLDVLSSPLFGLLAIRQVVSTAGADIGQRDILFRGAEHFSEVHGATMGRNGQGGKKSALLFIRLSGYALPVKREEQVYVGAFGKHPGWNDHIDDLGLETQTLTSLKRSLYFDGVGANIDRGVWEQLGPQQRLSGFQHEFVMRDGTGWTVGLMWKSRDGKNRKKYPMIICLQAVNVPLLWCLTEGLSRLRQVERVCLGTTDAADVIAELQAARSDMEASIQNDAAEGTTMPDWLGAQRPFAGFADHPEMNGRSGYHRVRYRLQRECGPHLRNGEKMRGEIPAQHLRLPACHADSARAFLSWYAVIHRLVRPDSRLFMVRPFGLSWMDVLIGAASTSNYYCLQANLETIPSVTSVPFNVDEPFCQASSEELATWDQEDQPLYRAALDLGIEKKKKKGFVGSLFGR